MFFFFNSTMIQGHTQWPVSTHTTKTRVFLLTADRTLIPPSGLKREEGHVIRPRWRSVWIDPEEH